MQKSDRIKAEVSLRQIAESSGIVWDNHKSQPARGDYWGPCPFHEEKTASFHVVETGGVGGFFKCFGCHKGGTVIDFVQHLHGLDFVGAVRRLAQDSGIAGELSDDRRRELENLRAKGKEKAEIAAAKKAEYNHKKAKGIWTQATVCEVIRRPRGAVMRAAVLHQYLTARGVKLAAIGGVPGTLRAVRELSHRENGKVVTHTGPAMIAAIGRDKVLGVHRTWISATGRARFPDGRKVSKQWLGRTGSLMGQPCVLSPSSAAVVVGEGIETTLCAFSALIAAGQSDWSAEAALSRGAITGPAQDETQIWTPRPGVKRVLLLGEGSSKNPTEARQLYEGAAARLRGLGLTVQLVVPHGRWDHDADFADMSVTEFMKG